MLNKRNLIIFSLLVLGVLLVTSCLPKPLVLVAFDSQGGSAVEAQTVEEGGLVTEPAVPTKIGSTFGGWYKEPECTNLWDFDSDTLTADVTLYAKWTTNTYTVTFMKNDAAATGTMSAQTITSGSSANLTACAFIKTGWTFAGWAITSGGTVIYADEASYTMGTANITLYAKWTPPTTFSLWDIGPAGGWIFYDKGSVSDGWRYLEAAPNDQSTSAEWGCNGVLISGADGTAVGTGEQNTIDIEAECTTPGIAADICANLSLGGYSDWFLPSIDELVLMYERLKVFDVGGFAAECYLSSSESSAIYAWHQDFIYGDPHDGEKDYAGLVRAVRAF